MRGNVVAVIADVVDSRHISNRAVFQRRLKAVLQGVNKKSRRHLLSPFTLTLGDEFQALYARFDSLFLDILEISLVCHPSQIRFAIAYGPLSTDINPKAALEMDGRAFNDARRLINQLKEEKKTIIQVTTTELFNPTLVSISLRLFCNRLRKWNRNTLSVLVSLLRGESIDTAASGAGLKRRAVYKTIATHNLRDHQELLRVLTSELTHGLQIDEDG